MKSSKLAPAVAAALLFATAWFLLHPPAAHLPTSDLFSQLSVARHLGQGEGFLNDVVYPLSFAFPFAASIPQPLIHRPPGYPVVLLLPWWLGRDDPAAVLDRVYWLHVVLLGLLAGIGALCAASAGRPEVILPWLLTLLACPVLVTAALWGQVEVPAAVVILGLWARFRNRVRIETPPITGREATGFGLLAGALTLLRLELFWLPWLWLWRVRSRVTGRAAVAAGLACLLLLGPWFVRNQRVCGQPFFTLQAHAEHLKQTDAWPDYSIYRSLSPEPLWTSVQERPSLLMQKGSAGLRFFFPAAGRFFPWPLWLVGLLLLSRQLRAERAATRWRAPPLALCGLTLLLLAVQYALFSHALRHLLVLMPVVGLEILLAGNRWLAEARPRWRATVRATVLTGTVGLMLMLVPPRAPGLERARQEAASVTPRLQEAIADLTAQPPGPVFTDNGAVLWMTGRCGVWIPTDPAVTAQIRRQVPALAAAPIHLLWPPAGAGDSVRPAAPAR